ncbi:MAG: hypothetical protein JSW11_19285 [Candidatus Heimdallarchaeota archaeon]|nr:MAG: hypothetical protein JSW11_19285 [Candidatus Heimdallarchaeota archaeon]
MRQNLIAFSGMSHSGKDLLFNQIMKLGRSEPDLNIFQNVIYYDWLSPSRIKKEENDYITNLIPPIREKLLMKINTLVYIHDISYQLLDEITSDFQKITADITSLNKNYQVILLLNRGHLITNETERNRIKNEVISRFRQFFPYEIPSYIVSLKGPDEQRLTNLIFTQLINKASDFIKEHQNQYPESLLGLDQGKQRKIRQFLTEKMNDFGFAGAFLLSSTHKILLAIGKNQSWQEKVGPQIIRMLDQSEAFDLAPKAKTNILRIEDFLMITQSVDVGIKLIFIGIESAFKFNAEAYTTIEQDCLVISTEIMSMLR